MARVRTTFVAADYTAHDVCVECINVRFEDEKADR